MKKLTALLLCCLVLAGCTQPAAPTDPSVPTGTLTEPVQTTTVTIYYGNENYDGFKTAEVEVEEINVNVLVDKLIEAGVLTDDVGIWSMQIDGTCLHLVFSPTFGELIRSQGTAGEYIIMGSVVNTFLDAFDAETVYITVGDDILESGHQVYDYELEFYE